LTVADIAPNLAQLAQRINAECTAALTAARTALEHARRAGELLVEAKAACGHGQWLRWLEANVPLSRRTAQGYMRLATRWAQLEAKAQAPALLTIDEALKLLGAPPEDKLDVRQMQLEIWRRKWEEANVKCPATTGWELRQWLRQSSAGSLLLHESDLPDDAELWDRALYKLLARKAAGHLLRTGDLLLAPIHLDHDDWQGPYAEQNRLTCWGIEVEREAGGFLHWCDRAGIDTRKGFRLPEKPPAEAWRAVQYDRHEALDDEDDESTFTEEDAARVLGVSVADLPARLHDYIVGHFYGFLDCIPDSEEDDEPSSPDGAAVDATEMP
jgi:hypothetical protein